MRIFVQAILLAALTPGLAMAQTAPAAPAAAFNSADTELGTLLDNPATKAVLMKHIPDLIGSDQIDMARGMTLKGLQQYAGDRLPDAKVTQIDADLAKIPAAK